MLEVGLIDTPVKYYIEGESIGVPLNLMYLAAYARQNTDVANYSILPFRLKQYNEENIDLRKEIKNLDVVCAGAFTCNFPDASDILKVAKHEEKATVLGGIFATFNADTILKNNPHIDYIVRGEGEITFTELIKQIENGGNVKNIQGISYRKGKDIIHNESRDLIKDLDTLPMPAYDLIPAKEYAKISPGSIYPSRGCTMKCKFCSLNEMWDYCNRGRSPKKVIEELEMIKGLGFEKVRIEDETISLNRKWSDQIFTEIAKNKLDQNFMVKTRVDMVNKTNIDKMYKAGVDEILFGVESIVEDQLKSMGKFTTREKIENALSDSADAGMTVHPVYIFSWPGETKETFQENLDFIKEWGVKKNIVNFITFLTPHPGTSLSTDADDLGIHVLTDDLRRYNHKQPVAIPRSLGKDGLRLIINGYHEVGEITNTVANNPIIPEEYIKSLDIYENLDEYLEKISEKATV